MRLIHLHCHFLKTGHTLGLKESKDDGGLAWQGSGGRGTSLPAHQAPRGLPSTVTKPILNTNTGRASHFLEPCVFRAAYSIILTISKTATGAARVLSVGTVGDMIKVSLHLISARDIIKNLFLRRVQFSGGQRLLVFSLFTTVWVKFPLFPLIPFQPYQLL